MIPIIIFVIIVVLAPVLLWKYSYSVSQVPKIHTKKDGKLARKVEQHMGVLFEKFHTTWWCPFGTAQTVVRQLLRSCPVLPFERELIEFEDGGAIGIDWINREGWSDDVPIAIFLPGITGSTHTSSYLLHAAEQADICGWRCLVVNPRGLGGVPLRTSRTYNAANSDDFAHVAKIVHERYPNAKKLACGFSMGGMILWNYLAEAGDNAHVDAGMIVSSPFCPFAASESIETFLPRILFNKYIAKSLVDVVLPYKHIFGDLVDFEKVIKCATIRDFDTSFVSPMFGYETCEDYYKAAALNTKTHLIRRPTLTLNAEDDYFSPINAIPLDDFTKSDYILGVVTKHGGHTAFMSSSDPSAPGLVEKVLSEWGAWIFRDYP